MNPQLPSSAFDFLWVIGIIFSLLPVASVVLMGLMLREVIKIRRNLEK